ncbi:GNAT family N-acetyltransferase [Caballeronia sp. dw_276]|jgi:GNAT superfamily N-acetyltransferase|uniref:GNAT family N-acetyltransferase n=1 Tax=Caballeronia sp. dw_276 TaxID=2719795 RepID=UPI001BD59318|nr:GNAT family N-acetyltransferase [Caballeronia sp. dw_276]
MNQSTVFQHLEGPAELATAFSVMQELRPHLSTADAFARQVKRQFAQGYRLLAACNGEAPIGLAGYRFVENLIYGRFVYVDDLVVTSRLQRSGVGAELLAEVRRIAREAGCDNFVLDTGLHMALAQRFYYRQGLLAKGMHFVESLSPALPSSPAGKL